MQQALGCADRIAAIRDFDETVSAQTFNAQGASTGATVRKRLRWIRLNILRLDQVGPGDTYVLYFDGAAGRWPSGGSGGVTGKENKLTATRGPLSARTKISSRQVLVNADNRRSQVLGAAFPIFRLPRTLSRAEPHFPQLPLSCYKLSSD
jgi:hypothetical protein